MKSNLLIINLFRYNSNRPNCNFLKLDSATGCPKSDAPAPEAAPAAETPSEAGDAAPEAPVEAPVSEAKEWTATFAYFVYTMLANSFYIYIHE